MLQEVSWSIPRSILKYHTQNTPWNFLACQFEFDFFQSNMNFPGPKGHRGIAFSVLPPQCFNINIKYIFRFQVEVIFSALPTAPHSWLLLWEVGLSGPIFCPHTSIQVFLVEYSRPQNCVFCMKSVLLQNLKEQSYSILLKQDMGILPQQKAGEPIL